MKRKPTNGFKPGGPSPNPAGRPRGVPDRRNALREALGEHLPAIVERMVEAAKAGDMTAASLILSRCLSPLRPTREAIAMLGVSASATPADIAAAVTRAAARGELPADVAAEFAAALASVAKVREVDELAARIAKLEAANEDCRDAH